VERAPHSPRIRVLRAILAEFGELAPAPPRSARPSRPEERDPGGRPGFCPELVRGLLAPSPRGPVSIGLRT